MDCICACQGQTLDIKKSLLWVGSIRQLRVRQTMAGVYMQYAWRLGG